MRIHKAEYRALLEPGNNSALEWPVCMKGYQVWQERVYARSDETRITFPLMKHDLFLSFAKLAGKGEPSKDRIVKWVDQHGLLTCKEQLQPEEVPARWPERIQDEVTEPQPFMTLKEFREEVRTMHQLLSLYSDVRERNAAAVMDRWLLNPPPLWANTPRSVVDKYLERHQAHLERYRAMWGEEEQRDLEQMANVSGIYFKRAVDIIKRCLNVKLAPSQLWLGWYPWDRPKPISTFIGLVPWYYTPDLLTGMYLQLFVLVANKKPTRRCENPACRLPFPATRRSKRFCNATCRSNARHYRSDS